MVEVFFWTSDPRCSSDQRWNVALVWRVCICLVELISGVVFGEVWTADLYSGLLKRVTKKLVWRSGLMMRRVMVLLSVRMGLMLLRILALLL